MKKRNKWIASLLTLTLVCGSFIGCGKNNTPVAKETEQATVSSAANEEVSGVEETPEPQTLRVAWWGNQARADSTMEMLELFEETHPGVTVEIEFADFSGYFDKLSTQTISDSLPDVIQMSTAYLGQYSQNNVLADLTPYIETGALDVSGVPQTVLDAGKIGEGIYALSTGSNAQGLAYRVDVVEQAGITIPMEMKWSEFIEICKTVYEKTGWKNIYVSDTTSKVVEDALRNNGLSFFNEDGSALGFDDPSYIIESWNRGLTAIKEGYAPSRDEIVNTGTKVYLDSWAYPMNANQIGAAETESGCTLEVVNIPTSDAGNQPSNYLNPAMYWAVSERSEVKDLAVEFIDFFVNETAVYDIVGIDRGIPIDAEVKDYMASKLEGADAKNNAFISYLSEDGRTGTTIVDVSPAAKEVRNLLLEISEEVYYGLVTDLEKAAKDYMESANKLLADKASE